ncbi:hypothetical protein [Candidatus Chromulinivorax destructor]|uniref:Uncharacterized protein n=1 Tax=Candidatus Chromulinivorax destructor TaxID=2066483 RepID=A0A345ZBD8_9BACT|nr:hypothetical protein [Candidatus Chromulinivorax destructor]AXK60605.1 hypothetical protein C0J27_02500 [Candidatus Chromulinivorax destructor]
MKNMKILFLLFISYSQMKASEESAEFVVNAADSIQTSKALQKIADAQPKKSTTYGSSFVAFFNPNSWSKQADQNNPAVQYLNKIEAAIQDYYDNSKWFNKSTGNTKKQNDAKTEIESLVAEYRRKLNGKDEDFVAYKATFEDLIQNAQDQFSHLQLKEENEPLFKDFSDLLRQLNPFSSKQESTELNNPASKLMDEMEEALSMYYKNTTHPIQYLYQAKDVTEAKNKNKAEALAKFKQLAEQYQAHKDDKDFAPRHDEFKELFARAEDEFSNENSSSKKQNSPEPDSMYSQLSKYMNSFFAPHEKKEEEKSFGPSNEDESKAQDAQALLTKMEQNIKDLQDKKPQLDNPKNGFNQFKKEKMTNEVLSIKEELIANVQQYIKNNGLLLESQKNLLGGYKIEQIITSKDKNKVIANDSQLRTVLNNAYKLFGDDIKIKLPLTKIDGSQSSFEGTFDAISERVKEDTQEETN